MPRIDWKFDVSLGNMISVATIIVSITAGWVALQSQSEAQADRLTKLETRVSGAENRAELSAREAQTERVRLTEILSELRTDIRYLRRAVEQSQK